MDLLDRLFVNVDCPNCGYGTDVQVLSVRLESTIFCPCCKISIHLVDEAASVHGAHEEIDLGLQEPTARAGKAQHDNHIQDLGIADVLSS